MPANINSVTVTFSHGIKREEYGPTKKAEVTITASVDETEDGAVILHQVSHLAMAKVADMLMAPRPDTSVSTALPAAESTTGEPPARRTRRTAAQVAADEAAKGTPQEEALPPQEPASQEPPAVVEDEWSSDPADIEVTDAELLAATSKRAGELGARDPIVKLIATFATRTEGAPFKVQEIPQAQRKDYLAKLAALTA